MSDNEMPVLSANIVVGENNFLFLGMTKEAVALIEKGGAIKMKGEAFGMPGTTILLSKTSGVAEFRANVTEVFRSAAGSATVIEVVDPSFDPKSSS